MRRQAAGYFLILLPPVLVIAGIAIGFHALGLVFLVMILPLLRSVFGDAEGQPPLWTEREATLLHALPLVGAACHGTALGFVVKALSVSEWSYGKAAGLGGSLWIAFVYGSCIAHELLHRRDRFSRNAGRALSGAIGYPILEHEHFVHHLRNGQVQACECPALAETVWGFSLRRLAKVVPAALERDAIMAIRHGNRLAGGLPVALAAMACTGIAFAWAGGLRALLLYLMVAACTAWAMQVITYIQHWGLEQSPLQAVHTGGLGWEDGCRLQTWLTLSICFHQAHHQAASLAYYLQKPTKGAPKAPAGYGVLVVVCMVPPLWRSLMLPALARWKCSPHKQSTAGRRLICFK